MKPPATESGGTTPTLQDIYTRALKVHYCNAKDLSGVAARWSTLTRFCDPSEPITNFKRARAEDIALAMRTATWKRGEGGPERPYAESSINRTLALLGKLLSMAHEWEHIPSVPKMPKARESNTFKRRSLSEEEYKAMLQVLGGHPNPRWAAYCDLLRVLWGTGCRMGELVGLTWSQVDLENRVLIWDDTKGGNAVGKPMTRDVYSVLKARRDAKLPRPFSDYSEQTLKDAWDWACKVIGIQDRERVVRHSIRHSAATRLLSSGQSLAKTRKFMGHKSILTTLRYEHLQVDDLREAAEALEAPSLKPRKGRSARKR